MRFPLEWPINLPPTRIFAPSSLSYVTCHLVCQSRYQLLTPRPPEPNYNAFLQEVIPSQLSRVASPFKPVPQVTLPHCPKTYPPLSANLLTTPSTASFMRWARKNVRQPRNIPKAFVHTWEAEEFRSVQYDLSTLTPAILYPEYTPKNYPHLCASGRVRPRIEKQEEQEDRGHCGCERWGQGYKAPIISPLGGKPLLCCQN